MKIDQKGEVCAWCGQSLDRAWALDEHQRVRFRRLRLGLTQLDLALEAGISQGAVGKFETGRTKDPPCLSLILRTLDRRQGIPRAVEMLERYVEEHPEAHDHRLGIASLYYLNGELAKAKNMLVTDFYRDMATISGRAHSLGSFELFHDDWRKLFEVVQTYESISAEDIQRVMATYFTQDNRTVITLIPIQEREATSDAR